MPRQIHHRNNATVVHVCRVVKKSNLIASGRDARMADPAGRFIENMANRKLKTLPARHIAHDRERFSVRGPIRPVDILCNLAR